MSEQRFKVGDRVRVVCARSPHCGAETTITAGPRLTRDYRDESIGPGYEVDLPNPLRDSLTWPRAWFSPSDLVPVYDGNEKTSWSELADIWTPSGVSA